MILDAGILSVTDEEMEETWNKCIGQFTALALGAGVPVLPAVPHVVADTLKTLLGVAVEAGVSGIPEVDKVKALVGWFTSLVIKYIYCLLFYNDWNNIYKISSLTIFEVFRLFEANTMLSIY